MKTIIAKTILTVIFVTASSVIFAQDPPPPPPGSGHGGGSNQTGGSAPLAGGLAMLLTMGAGYAAKRIIDAKFASKKT
jgi:hypothetical protein